MKCELGIPGGGPWLCAPLKVLLLVTEHVLAEPSGSSWGYYEGINSHMEVGASRPGWLWTYPCGLILHLSCHVVEGRGVYQLQCRHPLMACLSKLVPAGLVGFLSVRCVGESKTTEGRYVRGEASK